MTAPATYAVQDGCHNCRYMWTPRLLLLVDIGRYVCMHGMEQRTGETVLELLDRVAGEDDRDVYPAGKCSEWALANAE